MLSKFSFSPTFDRDFDELWKLMFHTSPMTGKPPLVIDLYGSDPDDGGEISDGGVLIQMAVAGYKDKDIKVYTQDNVLYIEGDNTKRDNVPEKFKSKFVRTLPSKGNIALDKTKVKLEDGILSVSVPFVSPEENRTYLFGE
jgi:HSP20 family molecular chaperone IbpA